MSERTPEGRIRAGVDRYTAVVEAQRAEAERIRKEREQADQEDTSKGGQEGGSG